MQDKTPEREPIPEHFQSVAAAAEFWDSHDVADYDDLTQEAHFEVDLQRHRFLTALEPTLAQKVADHARQQGISTETLIHLWLAEKVAGLASSH
jgi:hypothetical protein